MDLKPDATIRIPVKLDKEFFRFWLDFLKPFHKLTKRETDVAVGFLYHRFQLSQKISDSKLLDENTVNEITKRKIREECGVTLPHFQVIMGKLKKSKIFVNNRLNPRFVPNITKDTSAFQLLFLFDISDET